MKLKMSSNRNNECCCAVDRKPDRVKDCILCGKPLVYFSGERLLECQICHKVKPANTACENGHFICDECHSAGGAEAVLSVLRQSGKKDPIALLQQVLRLNGVHLHGPEHHSIVPCVLITAYHNCGGKLDFENSLMEAWKRGQKIPGGACGFLGVCGAASGAGIFASIVCGATPLTKDQWGIPQRLTAACLDALAEVGGPRCCKRTSRIAIECAAEFSGKEFGVPIPISRTSCEFWSRNRECIRQECPFFPVKQSTDGR